MPTVTVDRDSLFEKLGRLYTDSEFNDLCFEYGAELDAVQVDPEKGTIQYKIEIAANRYDLLSLEGIAQSLKNYISDTPYIPEYHLFNTKAPAQIVVKAETSSIRPYVVGAILRNVKLNPERYASLIDLQEKLHQNLCRRRSLVAIGVHDLDTLRGPFVYTAQPPEKINFVPLNETNVLNGSNLTEFYASTHLKPYLHIIADSPVYPVIYDSNEVILSLPPIINGNHSKVTLSSRNLLFECTATDLTKAGMVLNTLLCTFSSYADPSYTIEPLEVIYEKSHTLMGSASIFYPELKCRKMEVNMEYVRSICGLNSLTVDDAIVLLKRMTISSIKSSDKEDCIMCTIPLTRPDILHPCDIAEDISIAYGVNKIVPTQFTAPTESLRSSISNQMRRLLSLYGYNECLNTGLCSADDLQQLTQKEIAKLNVICNKSEFDLNMTPVAVSNPKTKGCEFIRTSLLSKLLRTMNVNKSHELPLKVFEIGDVVTTTELQDVKCENRLHIAFVLTDKNCSGLEEIHGVLESILESYGYLSKYAIHERSLKASECATTQRDPIFIDECRTYSLFPSSAPTFMPGRQTEIVMSGQTKIGVMGVIHPLVLKSFGLSTPASAAEINLAFLMESAQASTI